jgi:TonB family protein
MVDRGVKTSEKVKTLLHFISLFWAVIFLSGLSALAEERKATHRVEPVYPEVMRRMNTGGNVKLKVVIAADGRVEDAEALGGHPMFIAAAVEAVKRWRFEPGPSETTVVIEMKFDPLRH